MGPTDLSAALPRSRATAGPWGRRTCPPRCRGRAPPRGRGADEHVRRAAEVERHRRSLPTTRHHGPLVKTRRALRERQPAAGDEVSEAAGEVQARAPAARRRSFGKSASSCFLRSSLRRPGASVDRGHTVRSRRRGLPAEEAGRRADPIPRRARAWWRRRRRRAGPRQVSPAMRSIARIPTSRVTLFNEQSRKNAALRSSIAHHPTQSPHSPSAVCGNLRA